MHALRIELVSGAAAGLVAMAAACQTLALERESQAASGLTPFNSDERTDHRAWVTGSTRIAAASNANCGGWNTRAFFKEAALETVVKCLRAGADPNARNEFGYSPLHLTAWFSKDAGAAAALLEAGADLKTRTKKGYTSLHIAAWLNNNPAVASVLLEAGADPNARTTTGHTPLHLAARFNGNPEVVVELLRVGADPNAREKSGGTPLEGAVRNKNPEVFTVLHKAAEWAEHPAVTATRAVGRLLETDAEARSFAAHAVALRAAIVKGGGIAVLSRIPGGLSQGSPAGMWPAFFGNTMVALGRLRSPGPAALYYNPLLDVAVGTSWAKEEGGWRVVTAQAFPGESFGGPPDAVPSRPSWVKADHKMVESLSATTVSRLADFHRFHPPEAESGVQITTSFADDAAYARAAWPRLLWNARQHAAWTSGAQAWLHPTLEKVTETLSLGDANAVTAAAPATDAATAEAVAGLPEGLAARLVLDMILDGGGDRRLLIGSLPEDGQIYFLVQCRLKGTACSLRRIVIVSLLDNIGAVASTARRKKG